MKTNHLYILLIVLLQVSSCDIKENTALPNKNIYKIINNGSFENTYFANSIIQTKDSSYLVLGSSYEDADNYVWLTPYLAKLDKNGITQWEVQLEAPYVNPVAIWEKSGNYYLACMNEISLGTHILSVDINTGTTELVKTLSEIVYPLALTKTPDNGLAIEGYQRTSRNTTLSKLSSSYEIEWTKKYPLIENGEEMIIRHISKRGKQFPFFVGYVGDNSVHNYFINGFYRYSFSLIFTDNTGNNTGVLNGFRYETAISSAFHISGEHFFFSMFNQGANYFLILQEADVTDIASIKEFDGAAIPSLEEDAIVKLKKFTIDGKKVMIYASNSKNNQILLHIYDALTGEFITSKSVSDYYPIEINDLIQTKDGGLAIIGRTIVTGRFPRIFFMKLAKEKLILSTEED